MYCDAGVVRGLCKNRPGHLGDDEISAAASVVDAEIDAAVGAVYFWPKDSRGAAVSPVPAALAAVANLLTAGFLEQLGYSHMAATLGDGGDGATVHDSLLQRKGRGMLRQIVSGRLIPEGLERCGQARGTAAPTLYSPVRGLRGGRGL